MPQQLGEQLRAKRPVRAVSEQVRYMHNIRRTIRWTGVLDLLVFHINLSFSPPVNGGVELKRVLGAAELFGSGALACAHPCLRRIVGIHANTQDFGAHPRLDPCPPLRTGTAQNHPPVLARARCGSLG